MIPYKINPLGVLKTSGESPILAAYSNGVSNENTVYYTRDFITWNTATIPLTCYAVARYIVYVEGTFIVLATDDTDSLKYRIAWTKDFQTWKTTDGTHNIYTPNVVHFRCAVPIYQRSRIMFAMAHPSSTIGSGMFPIYYNANNDTIEVDETDIHQASTSYSQIARIDRWNTGIATVYCSTNNAHANLGTLNNWATSNSYSIAQNAGTSSGLSYVPNAATPFIVSSRIKSNTSLAAYTGTTIANLVARTAFAQTDSDFLNNAGTAYYIMPYSTHSSIYKFTTNGNPSTVSVVSGSTRQFTKDTQSKIFCAHGSGNNHAAFTVYDDNMTQIRTTSILDGTYLLFQQAYVPTICWCPAINKVVITYNSRQNSGAGCFIVIDPETLDFSQITAVGSGNFFTAAIRYDETSADWGDLSSSIVDTDDYGSITELPDKTQDYGNIGFTL